MHRRSGLLAAVAAATATAALFAGTAAADAACYASTPAGVTYADPVDGDAGLAPEITTVRVSVDASCRLVVDPGIASPLGDGDAVLVYVDADGDPATGSDVADGADVVVGTVAAGAAVSPPVVGAWDGTDFAFGDAAAGPAVGNGGFSVPLDALGIVPGTVVRLVVAAMAGGAGDAYFDIAPDAGAISLPVRYIDDAERSITYTAQGSATRCTIPRTRGMSARRARSRLRAHGCTVAATTRRAYSGRVRRGRVIGTSVRAGRRTGSAVRLVVSRGRRPRRAHAASADAAAATRRLARELGSATGPGRTGAR